MKARTLKGRKFISREFEYAMRSNRKKLDALGINKGCYDRWVQGVNRVDPQDPRILKFAEDVGFPKEKMFEEIGG